MIKKLKSRLKVIQGTSIFKNLVALGFLQLTNYLLPLIIIPYTIRVIGVENFGTVSLVQALMMFLTVVTDYGFNLTSTREISLRRENNAHITQVFNSTISTKLILAMVTLTILISALLVLGKLQDNYFLFLGGFMLVLGQLLLPVWFFQGLEKMQFITYLNLFAKIITVVLVFTLIREEQDYNLVLPAYAIGNILAAFVAFYIIRTTFNVRFSFSSIKTIKAELKGGFAIFLSGVSINLYNSSSILVLGLFASDLTVGYYSAAEKVTLVVRQLLSVLSQAIYPYLCKLAINGMNEIVKFWRKVFIPFLVMTFLLCLMIFIFAESIALFLIGHFNEEASLLIKIMAFIPFVVATNIPSYQTLIAFNLRYQYTSILVSASILHIIVNIILSHYFKAIGTSVSLLFTELYISAGLFIILKKSSYKFKSTANGNL